MNHVLQSILSLAHTTLGLKPDELDPDANILELGLDSLMIIKLAQEIERRFGVTLEARWFLTTMPSMADLARHVLDERPQHAVPMRAAEASPEPRDGKGMPGPACTLPDLPPVGATHGPGLSALFEAQLRTMQTLFAEQLRALGGNLSPVPTPDATPNATPDTSRTDGPVRLERNIRGFVLEPTPLTDQQAAFVRELVARHTARTGKSNALGRRSGTLADWKSSLSFRPELRATAYPLVAESTFGGRFRDVDGNEYIDIALGMGVHFLGHNPPYVVEALRRRLERGFGLGPQCDLTAEAAERIRRLTGMERVSFCNTGSEAVMFALRLARAKTGRPLIALFNGAYHGTFDGVLAASEERGTGTYSPGTPLGMVEDVLVLDYNADSALDVLARRGNEIAAVLVEPVQSRKPGLQPQTFLRRLRRLTRERGICLIFDEMVNGFRRAPGGAQEHFGVRADMALYGKVAGGGLPVGIITGDKEYLDYIDGGFLGDAAQPTEGKTIVFGGTFCRHPLSMEGVVAATGYLLEHGPALQERVTRLTERLADRLNLWFQNERVPLRLMHFGPQFLFEGFGPYSAFAQPMELPLFYMLLLERGVYTWERRTCGLCTEHTEDDVRRIEEAVKDSVLDLRAGGFAFSLDKGVPAFFTPMTPTEERLYAIFQREHGQDAYHLSLAWKIREQSAPLDVELLETSLGECIRRHEALRSSFHHLDDQLVRKVVDEPAFALERIDAEGRSTENILGAFVRPFDLERAPLMRAGLARLDDGYLFVLDLLHIAADGASLGILLDDLNALMNGQTLPAHSGTPRAALGATDQERVRADTDFWVERLADLPPLELPLDFPGKSGSPLGRREWMTLDAGLTARARAASRAYSVTMNMFLNGVYALLLHKLCGGTRFCVGMAEGGRHGEDMARVMGMFVNTVPQDFAVQPEWTLSGFMAAVRGACAESMDKNRAPYGDVAGRLGRSPAATMLSYEKADQRRPTWPGLEFTPLVPPGHGAMYDFAIDIVEMDGVLHCNLLSSEALRPETARCFGQCFAHLVAETARLAEAPATLVGDVSALPPIQAEWILGPWQGAAAPFDRSKTIVDLCREAAQRHADKTALVFRDDRLTYADLDRASAVLARHLAASGAGRDKVVAVLVERGPEFVLAALGAMRAGAAYLPLDPKAPAERIAFQLGDAAPCALISPPGLRPEPRHFSGPWLDARALATLPEDDALPVPGDPGPDDLAYVIYTSGTTGQPKGVMIEHHGLANLCHWFARHYAVTEADRATAFAPFIFDASVWEIFPMLAQGAAVHILDDDTRHDLARLHDYLRREKITICYFLSQVAEMIDGASLPDLRLLLGGGEVLHRAVPAGAYRHCNTYGPTEFTVTATSFDLDGSWPVPIGRLVDNAQGLILDPAGRLQPVGVPGELCLAGEQLARGYLNRPELTATAFVANPLATQDSPHARMYRTGDLCRWRPDGNIEFLGRIDTQIKIRGHRVEPSEIEKTALTCPGVAQCAVMVRDETGTPLLCAYVVPATDAADTRSVRAHLAGLLPPYMVPDRIMLVDALPMGPSGKIDRKALPAPAAAEHASEPPRTAEERLLAEIWAEQLHVERVGRADNFFELGGDSIKALMVTSRIRAKGYALNARDIFRDATIADLAPRLTPYQAPARQAEADTTTPSAPSADLEAIRASLGAEVECVHGLSPLQHGIVFHGQLHPDSSAYLEQNLLTIRGPLDAETLARRLEVLTARHGMLRAAVIVRGVSRPWLAVLPPERVAPVLAREDLRGLIHAERQARLADIMRADRERGFDPQRPPLIRFTLLRTDEAEHALLCTVHHIIVDGWSMGVLFSELFGATAAATRPTQFRDFILWLESQDKNAALAWWRQRLAGAEPSEVPGHVPSEGEYRGRRTVLPLPEGFEGRVRALAANTRLTVNTLLQATWAVVLARCTMKDDVVFGEVVAGRPPELPGADGVIGLCANTVPARARCEDGGTFLDLAARLRDDGLTARRHAHCSLAEIQGAAGVGQDLLTHFFVLENYPAPHGGSELAITAAEEFSQTSFDFAVVWEERDGLDGFLVSNAASFEQWRVEALAEAYATALDAVSRDAATTLAAIDLISPRMRETLLARFRAPVMTYPAASVVELFRRTVASQPAATALVFRDRRMTYAELDRASDALARRLATAGAGPERIVAVLLHRGPFFAVALLAVLKSGAAFLPLAADAPAKRLLFQLEDSGALAVIGETALLENLDSDLPRFDVNDPDLFADATDAVLPAQSPDSLAYVIYTSGTTGLPKGVAVEHRALTNQTLWTARQYGLGPDSRLTLFAAHAFDVAIWELFPGLVSGAVLHVLGDELRRDLPALAAYLRDNAITDTWMPPHVAALFLKEHSGQGLRSLTAGGDVFKPQGDYPFLLYNNYGPTECAITSTSCRDFAHASPLSIGLPVDNTDMYILDRGGRLQPMGVAGELCITGVQVARGYLNRPELTAASFVPNPFATGPDTARMYKTGDLCRWLPDGSIEFLGRIDQQVKIRGHRIELGEIEKTAQAHPLVAQCVVRVDGGQLCAYIVTRDGADLDVPSVRDFLAEGLPPYMVPEHVLFLDSLPLTASGKIDKKALPAPKPALADFVPPTTPAEEILCTILAEVLERDRIGLTDDFFQLGGDSIKALMVASRLWAKGFRLDLKHLFARAGLAAVARSLVAAEDAGAASPAAEQWRDPAVSPTERERVQARFADRGVRAVYRVTPMQEAMLAAREAEPAAYVIDNWADLDGRLDPDALRERWRLLVARHDALRTVFDLDGERPWQVVLERGAADFRFENLRGLDAPAQDERMRQIQAGLVPPRLDHGPLVRIVLFGLGDGRFRMLLSWHHLVLDGWSLGRVLGELFAPESPVDPAISFKGYMRFLSSRDLETDLAWWREALRGVGAPALLPRSQNGRGASRPRRLTFALPRQVDRKLRELAADQGLTLSTLLQAAWAVILARHANQDEVVFGSVVSGRPAAVPGVERLVGLCVATMPVRVACPATESFVGLARTIQTWNLDAEPHAVCSQAEMRNLAGAGLDQLFVFENQPPAANAPDLTITPRHGSGLTGTELAMEWSDPGRLTCAIHYNATLFDDWRMEAVRDHWLVLLEALAQSPEAALGKVSMLTPAEERRILVHCNRTERDFGPPATAVGLFRDAARRWPDNPALVGTDLALTYAELDRRTDVLATRLAERGAGPERIVGILLPRRADFIVAALAVLKAGAAYLPLDPDWPAERLGFVAADAGAPLLVDSSATRHLLAGCRAERVGIKDGATEATPRPLPAPKPGQLAYVIYTSGSTGRPKGVLLEHAGLANLCRWQHADFPLTAADVCTAYAPWTFDASVYEIFPALTVGAALHVLPEDLRLDASGLRDYFRRNRVSVSFLPPQVGHQVLDGHDFPDLRVVTLAGDKPGRLAPRPFTVRNCYGPTEFTVCATSWPVTEHRAAPPIGAPIANARCSILGRHGQLQPFGAAGELCLSGVQMARGYLNRPEQTGAAFVANPFVSDGPHARVYRTGDLCRLMPDGNLEFLGRIDGQVKLRGQRLEPGEIESALLAHPLVTAAVAVLHAEGQAALLAAYATVLPGVRESELSAWLAARLPRWMLPQAIVLLDAMPLTANGKIDRDALPRPLVAARGDSAPRGPEEKALAAAWRDILGVDSPGLEDNFLALGGDSIKAMLVVARMRAMGYGLTSRDMLHGATLAATASQLRLAPVAEGAAMVSPGRRPAGRDATALAARFGQGMEAVYGLTPMQEGLLYHHTLEPGSPAYVEQSRLDLRGPLDADELARRVTQAGRRHGSLRTVFAWKGLSQPWQIVLGEAALVLERTDLTALPAPEQDERMRALLARVRADGLDLERGPLLRLTLCALGPDHHALLVSFHHIILDGWSLGVLAGELFGATVPAPAPPFARYVDWLQGRDQAAHLAFWATYLEGARSASLPGRKAASTRDDRDLPLQVGPDLSARLSALAIQSGVTVNTVLQAAWAVALGRTVNEDDVIFGAVYSGRDIDLPDAAATVGLFVNTVPVRVRVNPERTVRQLLAEVRDGSRALEAHVHVPLTDIRRQAGAGGALVEHLFVFENLPPLETGGALAVETAGGFNQTTYDLALVLDHGRELRGRIQYNAAALDPWLVEGLGRHFVTVLRQFADNADMRTATVRLIEPRANVVAQRVPAPRTTVVDLFRRSATRHAARTALVDGAARWTYAELDARSEALAHRLRELGAGPESVVAMLLPRSTACVLGLLAILKAGAAYLVLDPGYPDERLAALLADAAPRALIATADHAARVPGFDGPVIDIAAPLDAAPGVPPSPGPRDLAYLVHTSGTTGRPKGVMIEHRSLANFCAWHVEHYRLTPEDRAAHVFSFAFDASAWGIFPLLAAGAAIHILDDATRTDPRLMHAYFEDHAITLANIPTVLAEQFQTLTPPRALRLLATGGDALRVYHPRPYALYNEYGPSEATIMATCQLVRSAASPIPIGRPIAGARCLLLDRHGNPQPAGLPGELHLAGPGLARGYLNQPEQTARAFVPNPFADPTDPDDARLYRTGDLCRELADGSLEFLGRIDDQLGIRGFRVEPAEIEQVLLTHPDVDAAVVLAQADASGDPVLCAYVAARTLDEESLLALARRTLPAHMVPSRFVRLDVLPLTSNGKIDRAALPKPSRPRTGQGPLPGTALELALARIWRDVLGIDGVGLDEDFYRLGGDSLKAVRLAGRLESVLGRATTTAELMGGVTIRSLVRRIESGQDGWRPLVPLREGVGTAVVLIHAVGGSVLCYRDLVDALPEGRPVFVLPPYGMDHGHKPDTRLDVLAARYVPALIERFPDGDFLLVGLCMAGMTAWELARQLLGAGCAPRGVVSLNTRSRLLVDDHGQPVPAGDIPDEVPEEAVAIGLATMGGYDGHAPDNGDDRVRAMLGAQLLAWGHYVPVPLPLAMTCLRPADPVDGAYLPFETRPLGWDGLALAGATERYCPGNHFSMFKAPHAATMAAVIEELAATSGAESDAAPLTPIQRWFFGLDMRHGQFFQSVVLRADRVRPPRMYQTALVALAERHEMLRAVYQQNGGRTEQRVLATGPGFGFRICDAEELEPMVEEATRATDLTRGPLAWAVLVPGREETGDALALVIHHLIVDGVSWRVLQQDFTAALSCLDEGRPVELPSAALADDGSFPAWARRLAEYAHDPTVLDQAAFWRSVLAGRPGPLSSDAPVAARRKTDLRECSVLLDAESTRNLLGPCRKTLGADMDALLLAGLVLAARDWRGAPGLTVDLEGHGRQELFPDVAPGAIVGWFTTVHPVALMARADLVATVNGVRQALDAAPDKGLGFGVLKHVAGVELTDYTADVLFNYLGDASDAGGGPLALERIGFPSDVAPDYPQQAKLAVTGLIRDGRLDVTIEAHGQEFTAASLEGLLTALERRLREIAGYGRRGERQ